MTVITGEKQSQAAIFKARDLVDWKIKQGVLKVPVPPSKIIISPQLRIIKSKQHFRSKQIHGLAGMHLCANAGKGIYISGGWGIGAPALIAVCEELRILGAEEIYLTGICGRLTKDIKEGEIVVAASALREEGTSQHYLPSDANIEIQNPDKDLLRKLSDVLPAKTTKFVSTDAPYRETHEKYNSWCKETADMIDMETAALYAFSSFYNIRSCSVGIGADTLADGTWRMTKDYSFVEKQLSDLIDKLAKII